MSQLTHGQPSAGVSLAAGSGQPTPFASAPGGWLARIGALVRRIIGVPDYDTYVRHMAACHPGEAPLSERDFAEERMTAKYSKPGQRCC